MDIWKDLIRVARSKSIEANREDEGRTETLAAPHYAIEVRKNNSLPDPNPSDGQLEEQRIDRSYSKHPGAYSKSADRGPEPARTGSSLPTLTGLGAERPGDRAGLLAR
jgi:hypothetical protein